MIIDFAIVIGALALIWGLIQFILENIRNKQEQKIALRTPIYLELLSSLSDIQRNLDVISRAKMTEERPDMTEEEKEELEKNNKIADEESVKALDKMIASFYDLSEHRIKVLSLGSLEIDKAIKDIIHETRRGMMEVYTPDTRGISRRESLWILTLDDLLFDTVLVIRKELGIKTSKEMMEYLKYSTYEDLDTALRLNGIILSEGEKTILKNRGSILYRDSFLSVHKTRTGSVRFIRSSEQYI